MKTETLFSHKSDEWTTPRDLFSALNREFHFSLDPCSTDENSLCQYHFTKADDGLQKNWGGRRYSAILRILKLINGSARDGRNLASRERLSSCLFQAGLTQDGFTDMFFTDQKSDSYPDG